MNSCESAEETYVTCSPLFFDPKIIEDLFQNY